MLAQSRRFMLWFTIGFFVTFGSLATVRAESDFWGNDVVRVCCDEADAVYADKWAFRDGSIYATVTGGGPRNHSWAPVGATFRLEPAQVKTIKGNPTGHAILFLAGSASRNFKARCFIMGPGI